MIFRTGRDDAYRSSSDGRSLGRRDLLKTVVGGAAVAAAIGIARSAFAEAAAARPPLKGRIKQGVSRWCYGKIPMKEFCKACADMGIQAIDLVGPGDWPTVKEFGLVATCTPTHSLSDGLNHKENHEKCLAAIRKAIEETAAAGFPTVVCFSGNRKGISDEEGAANCVEALKQVAGLAEEKKVTLVMELLNSKRDHGDYQCDHTRWGAEVCKKVGSPRVKLLYDIYHMQIMEGDLIATIRENIQYIGHFHTGGVPGRSEIDETQEINYPAVMRAIADAKFDGYVGHEFVPKRDPLTSLRQAVALCDV
jgi:hydroxypyruvate isomerase